MFTKRRAWFTVLLAAAAVASAVAFAGLRAPQLAKAAGTQNPHVVTMINNVTQTALSPAVSELSGATTAAVGGQAYTFTTRFAMSGTPISKAEQYAYEHLVSYLGAGAVSYDSFSGQYNGHNLTGRNVIGQITGTTPMRSSSSAPTSTTSTRRTSTGGHPAPTTTAPASRSC
jgi:hypothetical protein